MSPKLLIATRTPRESERAPRARTAHGSAGASPGRETATIKHVYEEKCRSLDAQTSKAVIDVRIAMDAAFAAAGAAAQKQEDAFTKQIDQLTSNVQLISKASDDKLTDLKDRIVAMESRSSVMDPTTVATLRYQAQTIGVLKQSSLTTRALAPIGSALTQTHGFSRPSRRPSPSP
jgi:hypothetical protein